MRLVAARQERGLPNLQRVGCNDRAVRVAWHRTDSLTLAHFSFLPVNSHLHGILRLLTVFQSFAIYAERCIRGTQKPQRLPSACYRGQRFAEKMFLFFFFALPLRNVMWPLHAQQQVQLVGRISQKLGCHDFRFVTRPGAISQENSQ